jgi:hypothetical protein
MQRFLFRRFFWCALAALFPLFSSAQTVTGSITGDVSDPSGAIVVGAKVAARNLDTGIESKTATNGVGLFRIDFLPVGHYQVTVAAPGFGSQALPPFALEVLQTANFNVKLSVSSTATTVDVSASAPILNTESPVLGR